MLIPGITRVGWSALAAKALAVFFFFLPFTYALQVLTRSPYAPVLVYLLLVGAMVWLLQRPLDGVRIRDLDATSIGFLLLILHHVMTSWLVAGQGDAGLVARVLVLFTVPLLLFWAPRAINLNGLELTLRCIAVAGLLVSIELVYENVSTQIFETSSYFQLLSKSYLHEVLGSEELGQLWWHAYRAAGLLEHPHATALFCNIGMCTASMLYIFRNRMFYLAVALISAAAVLTQGFRVPVLSQVAVTTLLGVFIWLEGDEVVRRRAAIYISLYVVMVAGIFIVDPTQVVGRYYLPGVQGNFQTPNNMELSRWLGHTSADLIRQSYLVKWLEGNSASWQQALFGHGLVGTLSGRYPFSDDLFLLALPLQYGTLGVIVFGGIWIAAIGAGFDAHIRNLDLKVPPQLQMVAFVGLAAVLLLAMSMAHSGILQRKVIYPLFPFFAGVLARSGKEYQKMRMLARKPPMADISVGSLLK